MKACDLKINELYIHIKQNINRYEPIFKLVRINANTVEVSGFGGIVIVKDTNDFLNNYEVYD